MPKTIADPFTMDLFNTADFAPKPIKQQDAVTDNEGHRGVVSIIDTVGKYTIALVWDGDRLVPRNLARLQHAKQ